MDIGVAFVADAQATELAPPRDGLFDDPASSPQACAVVSPTPRPAPCTASTDAAPTKNWFDSSQTLFRDATPFFQATFRLSHRISAASAISPAVSALESPPATSVTKACNCPNRSMSQSRA